ncbi:MAG: sigma-70 family RNA polymerase sigma factor [Bradyrhizobium sp.]|uniref:RNA polymerase sigma factor n=1 Tax=Bradyrhizobium sp. TaxID=376 RepID=UPI0025BCDC4C|nr:sigma-70 family RNA polymerase sigma factor [Bradyrhizobium sp.]MBI5263486.1 sigma-70 family RNA polymerase sigma factor [Bradyrhizobium sp.]
MAIAVNRHHLIVRAQGGDPAALDQLLAECQSDARRYAMRHCVMSEIDDAVQEALLIVTRHVRSLESAASFAGWLFTIVRRECARLSRRMFGQEALDDDRVAADLAQRSSDELRVELASALESLPPHYLEMILLRDFEELTIAEICERLGLTVATAKARLHRARLLVREYLIGPEGDGSAAHGR